MEIKEEYLRPDKYRHSFFDGVENQNVYFDFSCGNCSANNKLNLWHFLDKSGNWENVFNKAELQNIAKALKLPVDSSRFRKSHEGGQPYISICACINCRKQHLVYIGFYEAQPSRYIGTLQGVYGISTT